MIRFNVGVVDLPLRAIFRTNERRQSCLEQATTSHLLQLQKRATPNGPLSLYGVPSLVDDVNCAVNAREQVHASPRLEVVFTRAVDLRRLTSWRYASAAAALGTR